MDLHTATLAVLVVVSLAFAWSMGAHYTGAVMGMPYASHSIRLWPALLSLAVLAVVGATFASRGVQQTVGLHIVASRQVDARMLVVIELAAFLLTTVYTYYKVPTSTIQIVIFCIVGAAIAAGAPVNWSTIARLAVTWVLAPPVAAGLGYLFTRGFDLVLAREHTAALRIMPRVLVFVGLAASFALGANDVSNAVGVWSSIHLTGYLIAGLAGGLAMAVGALTWGQRILNRVAFDIVTMDLAMASAAQLVQALVILLAVSQGLFTSMNQALVGAMAGTGLARGRQTVHRDTLYGILRGWAISPITGFALSFLFYRLLAATIGG